MPVFVLLLAMAAPQSLYAQSEEDVLNSIGNELDDESAKEKEAARIEKEYAALKSKASSAMSGKKYPKAKEYYEQMLKLKPDSDYAKGKLTQIEEIQRAQKEAAAEAKYKTLITQADGLLAQEKWDEANAKYKAASEVMKDEAYPKQQMAKMAKLKADAKAAAEKEANQKKYNNYISLADKSLAAQDWESATKNYTLAKNVFPDNPYPSAQIEKVAKLKKAAEEKSAAEAKEKKYQVLLAGASSDLEARNWDEAKKKYNLALQTKPGDSKATQLLAKVDVLKAEYEANKEKLRAEAEYKEKVKAADGLYNNKKWSEAIPAYKSALVVLPNDAYAKGQIAKAEARLKEEAEAKANAAALESKFQTTKKQGEDYMTNSKWLAAIEAFSAADALKPGDSEIAGLLKKAKAGKKEADELALKQKSEAEAAAKLQNQYDSEMAKGNQAMASKDWGLALSSFKKAGSLKPDETLPKTKITEVNTLEAEEKKQAADKLAAEKAAKEKAAAEAALAAKLAKEAAEKKKQEELLAAQKEEEAKAASEAEQKRIAEEKLAAEKLAKEQAAAEAALAAKLAAEEEARLVAEEKEAAKLEAEKFAAEEAKMKEDFNNAFENYKSAVSDNNLEGAEAALATAITIFPNDPKVGKMKSELAALKSAEEKLQAEEQAQAAAAKKQEQQYTELLSKGDRLIGLKDYSGAYESFNKALEIKPNEQYPKNKLAEIDGLILAQNEAAAQEEQMKREQFSDMMAKGKSAMEIKNWEEARTSFNAAKGLMPKSKEPQVQLDALNKMQQAEESARRKTEQLNKEYVNLMAQGQKQLDDLDFPGAKKSFMAAFNLKPKEELPQEKLAETERLWKKHEEEQKAKAELEKSQAIAAKYSKNIQQADQYFGEESWDLAIRSYQMALEAKSGDEYASTRLQESKKRKEEAVLEAKKKQAEEAARLKAEQIALAKQQAEEEERRNKEKTFATAMSNAEKAMAEEEYQLAVNAYKKALEIEPDNADIIRSLENAKGLLATQNAERAAAEAERKRLAAIELAKRQEAARIEREAYLAKIKQYSPEELAKNYPDGITEEKEKIDDTSITKSVIVEKGEGRYLIKFEYPWGEQFYYLNGKKIRADAYNWNIRKYKF